MYSDTYARMVVIEDAMHAYMQWLRSRIINTTAVERDDHRKIWVWTTCSERFFPDMPDLVDNRVPLAQTVINRERAARIARMQQWNANYMRTHFAPG